MNTDIHTRLEKLMNETVAFSKAHVSEGGIPFSAFVVDRAGTVLGRGVNRVLRDSDPTAHAEVDAIRDACRRLRRPYLRGAILLASGEPCAMCYMNAAYAGIDQIYFAADRMEAAAHGFDYRDGYSHFQVDPTGWTVPKVGKLPVDDALLPFKLFQERGAP